jgi:hypothetical protein
MYNSFRDKPLFNFEKKIKVAFKFYKFTSRKIFYKIMSLLQSPKPL